MRIDAIKLLIKLNDDYLIKNLMNDLKETIIIIHS